MVPITLFHPEVTQGGYVFIICPKGRITRLQERVLSVLIAINRSTSSTTISCSLPVTQKLTIAHIFYG
jgi:hypothetical protein